MPSALNLARIAKPARLKAEIPVPETQARDIQYEQAAAVVIRNGVGGQPAILLADEPTGNLDSKNGLAVMELLIELHMQGTAICMVTHDQHFAERANRTVHLFDGQVVDGAEAAVG